MHKTERGPLSDADRLERIQKVLDRLEDAASDHVLLIEGKNDRAALLSLGINGDMFQVQSSGGPACAAEYVEARGGKSVILTDWDRRGNSLAQQLCSLLGGNPPKTLMDIRSELARLCSPYIKDIESLATFVDNLSAKVYER